MHKAFEPYFSGSIAMRMGKRRPLQNRFLLSLCGITYRPAARPEREASASRSRVMIPSGCRKTPSTRTRQTRQRIARACREHSRGPRQRLDFQANLPRRTGLLPHELGLGSGSMSRMLSLRAWHERAGGAVGRTAEGTIAGSSAPADGASSEVPLCSPPRQDRPRMLRCSLVRDASSA